MEVEEVLAIGDLPCIILIAILPCNTYCLSLKAGENKPQLPHQLLSPNPRLAKQYKIECCLITHLDPFLGMRTFLCAEHLAYILLKKIFSKREK